MLFSEVYSAYFNAVAAIIKEALAGELSNQHISEIIAKHAFSESAAAIIPALNGGQWLILNHENRTPIKHPPRMPLTTLQRRWLKTLLGDPRIALFEIDTAGLEDAEPLYDAADIVCFDRYADGDPYTDPNYIQHFKTILAALKKRRRLHITFRNRRGRGLQGVYIPFRLEYSAKDDKFRLETAGGERAAYINIARIESCALLDTFDAEDASAPERRMCPLTFILTDERNALDRVMLHFSDCRKETRRMDANTYRVDLWYDAQDEAEILIRVLSFGPMIRVTAPHFFIQLIKARLVMQRNLQNPIP